MRTYFILQIFSILLTLGASKVFAQSNDILQWKSHETWDFSAHLGPFLAFGLDGVDETLPFWGVNASHPTEVVRVEYGLLQARGEGVTLYDLTIDARIDYTVAEYLEGFIKVGLDFYHYKRRPDGIRSIGYSQHGGSHLSFGGFIPLTDKIFLRNEFKLSRGLGFTLYAGIGFHYRM